MRVHYMYLFKINITLTVEKIATLVPTNKRVLKIIHRLTIPEEVGHGVIRVGFP